MTGIFRPNPDKFKEITSPFVKKEIKCKPLNRVKGKVKLPIKY